MSRFEHGEINACVNPWLQGRHTQYDGVVLAQVERPLKLQYRPFRVRPVATLRAQIERELLTIGHRFSPAERPFGEIDDGFGAGLQRGGQDNGEEYVSHEIKVQVHVYQA